ncbi:dihydrolipoamide acetyltransferase family protein [Nocardia sp. NPDC051750]|uniref:dihydrolipoamide acetyltransferase family protein n=1 Tax=Nocardia sp. NPDC051750 TaxID=3364325 RepID=UPI0037940EF1
MAEFRMPSLGADMVEGTLLHWYVRPGQVVHIGDVVAEVDTTKAAIEVESFDDGILAAILVPEGATVPVGTPLATIEPAAGPSGTSPPVERADGETAPEDTPSGTQPDTATTPAADHTGPAPLPPPTADARPGDRGISPPAGGGTGKKTGHDLHATPLIRKLAEEAGIDIATVHGSGPAGRVVRADIDRIKAAASSNEPSPETERRSARPAPTPSTVRGGRAAQGAPKTYTGRASGYARRLASASGIELSGVQGSGPDDAVRARDVPTGTSERPPPDTVHPRPPRDVPGDNATAETPRRSPATARQMIAAAMTRSKRTVPHYYLSSTVDMDAAMRRLRTVNGQKPVPERIVSSALLLCAAARAARSVPELNGFWLDEEFRPAPDVHVGMVVSLREGGILVPTISDADHLSAAAMMRSVRDAVARTRAGRLRSRDTVQATITVTSLGDLGADAVFGVIPVPQVAIVGFGAVTEKPCAVAGMVGVRPQVTATLSADHRASDGAVGARFLRCLADHLQDPEELCP